MRAGASKGLMVTTATALASLALASPAWAGLSASGTFNVDRTDDPDLTTTPEARACTPAPNDCSLRGAIQQSNDAPSRDTVNVPAGTYTLSLAGQSEDGNATGDLDVRDEVDIVGAGARTTIVDANGIDGVLEVDPEGSGGAAAPYAISGVTLTGGAANSGGGGIRPFSGGGGIRSFDALTLTEVSVNDNTSTDESSGGGIDSSAPLAVRSSTISNNVATSDGGGIESADTLTITNSTLSGNDTGDVDNEGGAIDHDGGSVAVNSSTIANNTTSDDGGGGAVSDADSADVTFKNSIVANNTDTVPGTTSDNCQNPQASQGNNLEDLDTCGFNQPGTDKPNTDPQLGALANNGGPTDTRALQAGSPAIDAGDSDQSADQRGFTRPQDGDANGSSVDDIGAFELRPSAFSVSDASAVTEGNSGTTNATFTVTRPAGDGAASVNFATANGTATAGSDYDSTSGTLNFAAGETSKTVEVPVRGDTADEPNETLTLNLSAPSVGATIADSQGTATITDDDEPQPPANRAPTARNNSFSTDEDRRLNVPPPGVLGNDSDPDGDPLTAERVSGPSHGTLTLRPNGSFTYTPARDFNGRDSFVYRACDDGAPRRCDSTTVSITVRPVADGGGQPQCTITRGSGNDIVRGTSGADVICAGAGNDIVDGLGGNDIIRGGPGNDILRGDDGSDRLEGGSGNDDLVGGEGNDRLIGGSGADVLSGQGGRDSLEARDGVRGNDVANGGPGSDSCSRDPEDTRTSC